MTTGEAGAGGRRSWISTRNAVTASLATALAAALVVVYLSLNARLSTTNDALEATQSELESQSSSGIASVQAGVAAAQRAITAEKEKAAALTKRLTAAEDQLKKYEACMPELLSQITTLRGSVYVGGTGTFDLYVSPSQQVSNFCQPVLYGRQNQARGD